MRKIRNFFLMVILVLVALLIFGPYEEADLTADFDASALDGGVDAYFAAQEAQFDDITPGVQKQIIWVDEAEVKAPWSVLYVHGFSATLQEIRPVPDRVAAALEANLVFTRMTGHGRDGDALAQATVADWMQDVAEGLAVARQTGERVLIISTSTGGTLAAAAAMDDALMQDVAGIVMIAPNFGLQNSLAPLLTWPAARYWMPMIAGIEREFTPQNEGHGRYWTTKYPSVAVLPMAALVREVAGLDLGRAKVPALFWFAKADTVVRPDLSLQAAAAWGGTVKVVSPVMGPQDDPDAHVIAGDILSPGQTARTVQGILDWVAGL